MASTEVATRATEIPLSRGQRTPRRRRLNVKVETDEEVKEVDEREEDGKENEEVASRSGKVDSEREMKLKRKQEREEKRRREEEEKEDKRKKREEEMIAKKQQEAAKEEERQKRKKEMETKKMQDLAEKEEKRRKREEEKEAKRLKEEAEQETKNKKRKEREEKEALRDEKKRKQEELLKKQANTLANFLMKSNGEGDGGPCKSIESKPTEQGGSLTLTADFEARAAEMRIMDEELAVAAVNIPELLRNYQGAWRAAHENHKKRRLHRWGVRRHPKTTLFKKLKLQAIPAPLISGTALPSTEEKRTELEVSSQGYADNVRETVKADRTVDADGEGDECQISENMPIVDRSAVSESSGEVSDKVAVRRGMDEPRLTKKRKLLQFHENHRPAFYGSTSIKSSFAVPRNPYRRDPSLDYSYDSAEEWEEEEPGESLSDSDKEDDKSEGDEDEAADGFLVPDGYLSEDEVGPEEDAGELTDEREAGVPQNGRCDGSYTEDSETWCRREKEHPKSLKALNMLIEKALRNNCPLLLSTLGAADRLNDLEGPTFKCSANASGRTENRTLVGDAALLQALSIEVLALHCKVGMTPTSELEQSKTCDAKAYSRRTPKADKSFPQSCLPDVALFLMTSSHGIKKNVEILCGKYPGIPKGQLEAAIRKVADFNGGCWQVKEDMVHELGIKPSHIEGQTVPVTTPRKEAVREGKVLTTFFTKT